MSAATINLWQGLWERLRRHAGDSPTLVRDLYSMLSGWRIGIWLLLLNLILGPLVGIMLALAAHEDSFWSAATVHMGFGQSVACVVFSGLGLLTTLLVPLRAGGSFMGPRWGRYFDQVVLSGISPERYLLGKLAAQNVFMLLLLAGSLPYLIFAMGLGGVTFGYLLGGLLALWVYTNVLTVLTLAMGCMQHELLNVPGIVTQGILLFMVAWIPFMWPLGFLTPSRVFIQPILATLAEVEPALQSEWFVAGVPLTIGPWEIMLGPMTFYLAGSALLLVLGLAMIAMGPVDCLVGQTSTFGEVVLKGDAKRKRFLRGHLTLRRASEIAFFYENRDPVLTRYELFVRWGGVLLLGFAGLLVGSFWVHSLHLGVNVDGQDWLLGNTFLLLGLLAAMAWLTCCSRAEAAAPVRGGKLTTNVATADTWAWLIFSLAAAGISAIVPIGVSLFGSLAADWVWRNILVMALVQLLAWEYYLAIRWLSMNTWNRWSGIFAASGLMFVVLVMPSAIGMPLTEARHVIGEFGANAGGLISHISGLGYLMWLTDDTLPSQLRATRLPGFILMFAVHGALTLLYAFLAWRRYRLLERERKEWES